MTVILQLHDGSTVRLDYDGSRQRSAIRSTSIKLSDQAAARLRDGALYDLLRDAAVLLMLYAADWEKWPAELRPASRQRFFARLRRAALGSAEDAPAGH
jgi:hypothetical protein